MNYEPIPSLDYRYEISKGGVVRNVKTKRILKIQHRRHNGDYTVFWLNGKKISRTITSLLHEVHGILPKRGQLLPVAATVIGAEGRRSFQSLAQCAKFLSAVTHHGFFHIRNQLSSRPANLYGWQIRYREPEKRKMLTGSQANRNCELRR